MNLSDKMSYLKGLVDGMELDLTTKEGKVLGQLLDVLQETVLYVTDLQDQVDELTELCESLDEDLGDVEDAVFGDEEDDEDEADEFEDDDDDYDSGYNSFETSINEKPVISKPAAGVSALT